MNPPQGLFISFEGGEGCGKSTQIQRLAAFLQSRNVEVCCLREPGGTPLGENIRHLLKHDATGHGMHPEAEILLFAASRAELVRRAIIPALQRGCWVLCDRFLDSTTVYQGIARGLDLAAVEQINHFAVGSTIPDLTLVMDLDWRDARQRMLARKQNGAPDDRMEDEPEAFHRQVSHAFKQLADQHPQRIRCVDATGTEDQVATRVLHEIHHAFPSRLD